MNVSELSKNVNRNRHRRTLFKVKVAVLFFVLLPLAVSWSDNKSYLTISNQTGLYLHLIVDGQTYLYVAPDREIVHDSEPKGEFFVRASYSPGQQLSSSITRDIGVPYYSSHTGCSYNSDGGWACSDTPARGGAGLWVITPDTMLVQPE